MMDLLEDWQYVLNFWFGDAGDDAQVAAENAELWWGKSDETDELVEAKFSHRIEQAASGGLTHWLDVPEGRLAGIIVLDQFRRNVFRDTAEAFAEDALARRWCKEGLADGVDALLRPIERVFFYMPLEHSESLDDQRESVALFSRLLKGVPEQGQPAFHNFLNFAERHYEIVERFGRFPHRNAILGRESTAEELAFLEQPGSSF